MEAFYAVLPVFLLIAVGAAVHMTDVLPENTGAAMGLYVLKLALPVLMLHILAGASRLDLAHGGFWLGVIGAQMLCYLLGYTVDRLFFPAGHGPGHHLRPGLQRQQHGLRGPAHRGQPAAGQP